MLSQHADVASEKASKDIARYCTMRDILRLTENPELAHDTALRALCILDHTPVFGSAAQQLIRTMCHNSALEEVL